MFTIKTLDRSIQKSLQYKIDAKTKPLGSLGKLESVALKLGMIQGSLAPALTRPHIYLFAGDHGLAHEPISPYPQSVTAEMVRNFRRGGAAINIFADQHKIGLSIIDCGVKTDVGHAQNISMRLGPGTMNSLYHKAMTREQAMTGLRNGQQLVKKAFDKGTKILGFGEMGIGNSSAAALISARLLDVPLSMTIGPGTGCNQDQLEKKQCVLKEVLKQHSCASKPMEVMESFGGFEMITALGAMLASAELGITILVDGFIMGAVALAACKWYPTAQEYMIFSHRSASPGHQAILDHLAEEPLLDLEMRLGEGTGTALVFPLLQSACNFLNGMASFKEAEVSQSNHDLQ